MIARDTVGNMTSTMTYTFLGDGTKVSAMVLTITHSNGLYIMPMGHEGKSYRGSFVYNVSDSGVQTLESIAVSTGRLIVALSDAYGNVVFESDGFVTDHLGNVAAVVNLSDVNGSVIPRPGHHLNRPVDTEDLILEQNDYLPFGTKVAGNSQPSLSANRYRYAGKEEQRIGSFNSQFLDFGARYYDAYTCRWNAIDPLAHKYYGMSPYNYCGNDPVNFFDPDGKRIVFDKNCSADFKTKFKAAVDFMNEKGTPGDLAQLEQSSKVYYIADGRGKRLRNQFNSNTSTISWDPDCMFISDEGIMVSSTTILCHEIDHANDYDKDPENNKKNHKPNSDEQFGTKEERRACENEQKTAEKHGEVSKGQKVRDNHNGGKYVQNRGASPEEQSKACKENNDMLL